jgi:hypothetical protein
MRLRQIVLVAADLDRVESDFHAVFGWNVAYRDPVVAKWDLRNIVIPVANEFIEVVSPTRDGTSAGRHRDRIGGDGGYMVMFQVAERAKETDRLVSNGIRAVYKSDQPDYCLTQFHPADCGGLMLSWEQIRHPGVEWSQPDGFWHAAAGTAWRQQVCTDYVGSIRRVTLGGTAGESLAARYGMLLDKKPQQNGAGRFEIALPGPAIELVTRTGRNPIVRIELEARNAPAVLEAAHARGLDRGGGSIVICGTEFRLT